jgi:hypothetical protein
VIYESEPLQPFVRAGLGEATRPLFFVL